MISHSRRRLFLRGVGVGWVASGLAPYDHGLFEDDSSSAASSQDVDFCYDKYVYTPWSQTSQRRLFLRGVGIGWVAREMAPYDHELLEEDSSCAASSSASSSVAMNKRGFEWVLFMSDTVCVVLSVVRCCSVLQCLVVCWGVLQCVAVCCAWVTMVASF